VVAYLTVLFKDALPALNIKSGDNPDQESEFSCTYMRLEVDGNSVIELDPFNNIYFVADIDQNIQYRNNLGL
jgi:P2 family phage contractile tail tube protein